MLLVRAKGKSRSSTSSRKRKRSRQMWYFHEYLQTINIRCKLSLRIADYMTGQWHRIRVYAVHAILAFPEFAILATSSHHQRASMSTIITRFLA